jgi:hypothetical protein
MQERFISDELLVYANFPANQDKRALGASPPKKADYFPAFAGLCFGQ